jgi:hypothetical protein
VVSLSSLPTDPINASSSNLYYTYVSGGSFELTAAFESSKFKLGGDKDTVSTDGGSYPDLYEVGSNLSLAPLDYGDASLVGYWPLNEGTGTIAYDRSGKGNNGTWSGTSTPHYATSNGKTVGYFNGVNDYVNVGSLGLSGNVGTVSFWQKAYSLNDFAATIDSSFGGGVTTVRFYIGYYYSGDPYFRVFVGDGINAESFSFFRTPPLNIWEHYVVVLNGSTLKVFLNGFLLDSTKTVTRTLALGNYRFGSSLGGSRFFNGLIDDIRIYNRALSASEISALYNAAK